MNSKEKLLLTGATGVIGGALLSELAGKYKVVALVRDEQKLPKNLKDHYEVVKGSIWEEKVLKAALEGVRVVLFNTLGDPKEKSKDLSALKQIIFELKSQASAENPAQLILTTGTTSGGLAENHNDPVDETTPKKKLSPWDRSEYEDFVFGFQDERLKVAVVRPAWVYGGGSHVDNWINFARDHKKVLVIPEPDVWISAIHIEDLVSLYLLILQKKQVGVFNASEGATQIKNLVPLLQKAFDAEILEFKNSDEILGKGIFFAFAMRKDFSLISISVNSPKIGWKPKHTLSRFLGDLAKNKK